MTVLVLVLVRNGILGGLSRLTKLKNRMHSFEELTQTFVELLFVMAILLMVAARPAWGKSFDVVSVNPAKVRPTQSAVGFKWVEKKAQRFEDFSRKGLDRELFEEAPPAVYGPEGTIYILDNHHEFTALVWMGVKRAYVEVVADYSKLSWAKFEEKMRESKWLYRGDRGGRMSYRLDTMPKTLRHIKDDPYRALVSFVRKAGGFRKTKAPHVEFEWANALRKRIPAQLLSDDFSAALEMALEFATSREARHLPGFDSGDSDQDCEAFLTVSSQS